MPCRTAHLLPLLVWLLIPPLGYSQEVRFRNEVMAILSRGGCNQGACHGNLNGKGGLKLSLRGEDPTHDFAVLTRGAQGRRLNTQRPQDSLILLKASGGISHEGGVRFPPDSLEYALFHQWIAKGAPDDEKQAPTLVKLEVLPAQRIVIDPIDRVPLRALATFSDGKTREVTRLACFEPSNAFTSVASDGTARREGYGETALMVRYLDRQATVTLAWIPQRPDFSWDNPVEGNAIDRHVFARLRSLRLNPSPLCGDSVFLRRVFLDTLGVLPTPEETQAFLKDTNPFKRQRMIDHLLQRPEFADFWALKWCDLLRAEEKVLDRKGVQALHRWLRQGFLDGKPLNVLTRELLAGRGSTYEEPAANFYRALRDPQGRAEATAQVFLGVRLQCARCHNHPFDRWTMDDYYGMAAFFPRIQYRIVENRRRDRLDTHEYDGEQVVWLAREGEVVHPRGGIVPPRFPGQGETLDPQADRTSLLADWVARPDNPFFARTQANRIWYHLMGRGLVDPIDDFRDSNPSCNGPLLHELTRDLIASGFDLRHLVRRILTSQTYQLSATSPESHGDYGGTFGHSQVRPLPAETLLDALSSTLQVPARFNGYPLGLRAGQLPGVRAFRVQDTIPSQADRFLQIFGKPERSLSCECERSEDTTLAQAFQMIGSGWLNRALAEPDNRLGKALAAGRNDTEIITELFLSALCRPPREQELAAALKQVQSSPQRRAGLEDIAWGILNAKEFLLRH